MNFAKLLSLAAALWVAVGSAAQADAIFSVAAGKTVEVQYKRHRTEVSHIKVEFRGTGDWQLIGESFTDDHAPWLTMVPNKTLWNATCKHVCQIRVQGFMQWGTHTSPFGAEDVTNNGAIHQVTFWNNSLGDGSQNTTVKVIER